MKNFWQKLNKPFLVLAPMDDVTDYVFRQVVTLASKPDVFFTEFVSSDGLVSRGKDKVIQKLKYDDSQRPIVAQIWGSDPEKIQKAAKLVQELGFDGIDINMSCPDRTVMKKGAGAALIGNYDLVKKIIAAARKGANKLPLSVKTRLRHKDISTHDWISFLLEQNLDTLIIHGRTPAQKSKGKADWDEISSCVKLRNKISPRTFIVGNGDVSSYQDSVEKVKKYKVDGVMVGRGIFTNPWLFEKDIPQKTHTQLEHLNLLQKHIELFESTYKDRKNFAVLKKYVKIYIHSFRGANKLRQNLMETESLLQLKEILLAFISSKKL